MIQFQLSLIHHLQKRARKNDTAVENQVIIQTNEDKKEDEKSGG